MLIPKDIINAAQRHINPLPEIDNCPYVIYNNKVYEVVRDEFNALILKRRFWNKRVSPFDCQPATARDIVNGL